MYIYIYIYIAGIDLQDATQNIEIVLSNRICRSPKQKDTTGSKKNNVLP